MAGESNSSTGQGIGPSVMVFPARRTGIAILPVDLAIRLICGQTPSCLAWNYGCDFGLTACCGPLRSLSENHGIQLTVKSVRVERRLATHLLRGSASARGQDGTQAE